MSAIPCTTCGALRKVEQVAAPDGWHNPPCWQCGAPAWTQPYNADPQDQPAQEAPPVSDVPDHDDDPATCRACRTDPPLPTCPVDGDPCWTRCTGPEECADVHREADAIRADVLTRWAARVVPRPDTQPPPTSTRRAAVRAHLDQHRGKLADQLADQGTGQLALTGEQLAADAAHRDAGCTCLIPCPPGSPDHTDTCPVSRPTLDAAAAAAAGPTPARTCRIGIPGCRCLVPPSGPPFAVEHPDEDQPYQEARAAGHDPQEPQEPAPWPLTSGSVYIAPVGTPVPTGSDLTHWTEVGRVVGAAFAGLADGLRAVADGTRQTRATTARTETITVRATLAGWPGIFAAHTTAVRERAELRRAEEERAARIRRQAGQDMRSARARAARARRARAGR